MNQPIHRHLRRLLADLEPQFAKIEAPPISQNFAFTSICNFFGTSDPASDCYYYDTFQSPSPTTCALVGSEPSDAMPIVIDSGASRSLSPNRSDFVTFTPLDSKIKGVGATASIKGSGRVHWKIIDVKGTCHSIETQAYYVPDASIRLYSPQYHFKESMTGSMTLNCHGVTLKVPAGPDLEFPFNPSSNLPLMLPAEHPSFLTAFFAPSGPKETLALDAISTFNPVFESMDSILTDTDLSALMVDDENKNLSRAQKELLVWHWKFGHVDMHRLQSMMHPNKPIDSLRAREVLTPPVIVPTANPKTHRCPVPKCHACILGKMSKQPTGTCLTKPREDRLGALSRGHLQPGDAVSVDQYIVSEKGRLYTSFGREHNNERFSGGTIYVDHASGKIFAHHQVSTNAGETLMGKRIFEREAHQNGFRIKKYHGDNGVFVSEEFRQDCLLKNQLLDLSGVGAHHQNGRAERAIRTITSLARAMLIHSALHWSTAHDLSLWPMAMDHAIWIWNRLPGNDGLSPEEKFSGQKVSSHDALRRLHVWGAPTYVLEPRLQDGQKIPKFHPRSRQGRFMGFSNQHSSSVALVLNRRTGKITPQFHCVFDDFFQTVRGIDDLQDVDLNQIDWDAFIEMVGSDKYFEDDEPPPPLHRDWNPQTRRSVPPIVPVARPTPAPTEIPTVAPRDIRSTPPLGILRNRDQQGGATTTADVDAEVENQPIARPLPQLHSPRLPDPLSQREREIIQIDSDLDEDEDVNSNVPSPPRTPTPLPSPSRTVDDARSSAADRLGRGHRMRRPNSRIFNDDFIPGSFLTQDQSSYFSRQKFTKSFLLAQDLRTLDWDSSFIGLAESMQDRDSQRFFASMDVNQDPLDLTIDEFPTLALSARKSASAADNPRWHEAMSGEHADGFLRASTLEISTLQEMGSWEQVRKTPDLNVLDSTWAFKIKRFPDGLVRKLKARFCVRGDQQIEGVDFFDTFAPVVQWSTVRMMLVLSLTLGLASKQVDYVSAFCQAPIEEDVYVNLPKGWRKLNALGGLKESFKEDHVLKLKRSVYGLKQSPKNFFKLLRSNLLAVGFVQSSFDPCLFISPDVICVTYVDDCLFWARHDADIDKTIANIKAKGMDLQVEDSVAGFLGVHIDRFTETNEDGSSAEKIRLLQTGLIDRIIGALGLEAKSHACKTPAPSDPLPRDLEGDPFENDDFNYASVVGMCMYLCNNSRPDITFAVNQCARHSHKPTKLHAEYLKRIGRYLKGTRDKGLEFAPSESMHLDCYVDADFAGLYNFEDYQDPHCVRSRTGFVIFLGNCPIIWKSTLQKEIACSTMESEYIACSTACRDVLPLIDLVQEVGHVLKMPSKDSSQLHCTIWEDNIGALTLAQLELPRMTPRSKHIAVKYHWFREHVTSGKIKVCKIDTLDQIGDLFTKGLGIKLFEKLRARLVGW